MSASGTLRVPRGIIVGLVSGLGASVAHQAAGGHVALAETGVVSALAVVVCVLLARWRMGLGRLLVVAAGAQASFHLVMAGSSHPHAGATMGDGAMSGMSMSGSDDPVAMLLLHAVVALVTAGLARGVDQALLDLARALVRRICPSLPSLRGPVPAGSSARVLDVHLLPAAQRFVAPATSRGPPARTRISLSLP